MVCCKRKVRIKCYLDFQVCRTKTTHTQRNQNQNESLCLQGIIMGDQTWCWLYWKNYIPWITSSVVPGQLWLKLSYFLFCRNFQKNISKLRRNFQKYDGNSGIQTSNLSACNWVQTNCLTTSMAGIFRNVLLFYYIYSFFAKSFRIKNSDVEP